METDPSTRLPEQLHRYFWDLDPTRLALEASRQTILRRLLEVGGWDAVVWLRSQLRDAEIREFIVRTRGRGISPRRLRFWGLILSIPRQKVDAWIAAQRSNPWAARTVR